MDSIPFPYKVTDICPHCFSELQQDIEYAGDEEQYHYVHVQCTTCSWVDNTDEA